MPLKQKETGHAKTAEEVFSSLNAKDIEDIVSLFSEEASLDFPGSNVLGGFYLGRKKIKRFFQRFFTLVPDIKFKILTTITSGSTVVVEWVSSGITKKGLPYDNKGVSFFELQNGSIKEMRNYFDTEKLRN
ncbi:MAG: nuclear transport factor 2 family protein [Candidatus Eremiobacteraeota bacterium]|nr:nuclear transport factor 2 family protein [Candidatus Eremiobacteraeota bacterium]